MRFRLPCAPLRTNTFFKLLALTVVVVTAAFWLQSVNIAESRSLKAYEDAVVLSRCSQDDYQEFFQDLVGLSSATDAEQKAMHQDWLNRCESLQEQAPTGQAFPSSIAAVAAILLGLLAWMFPDWWRE